MGKERPIGPLEMIVQSDKRKEFFGLCEMSNLELVEFVDNYADVADGEFCENRLLVAQELLRERNRIRQKCIEEDKAAREAQALAEKIVSRQVKEKEETRRFSAWITFICLGILCLPAIIIGPFYCSIDSISLCSVLLSPMFTVPAIMMVVFALSVCVGKAICMFRNKNTAFLSFFRGKLSIFGDTNGGSLAKIAFWNLIALFVISVFSVAILFTGWYRLFDITSTMWWPFFIVILGVWSLVSLWIMATALLLEFSDLVPHSVIVWLCRTRPRYILNCANAGMK